MSAFTVLEIRSLAHNYEGAACDFAPHVTCGYARDLTKTEALELHERVIERVKQHPSARIRILDERVLLGRPGNPKVVTYAACVEPSELHDKLSEHANAVESGPFKEWRPHVSVHTGIEEADFKQRYADKAFEFSVKTTWNKRHEYVWLPHQERYPRVRRADGQDDQPIVYRGKEMERLVDMLAEYAENQNGTTPLVVQVASTKDPGHADAVLAHITTRSEAARSWGGVSRSIPWHFVDHSDPEEKAHAVNKIHTELQSALRAHSRHGELFVVE